MRYTVTETESDELLELDEVKEYLRTLPGDDSEDDSVILPLITAAREYCENLTGYALIPQTIKAYPECIGAFENLPRTPIVKIIGVTANMADGTRRPISESDYDCDFEDGRFMLHSAPEGLKRLNPIEVEYTAGKDELPRLPRQAMLLLIGHWYSNRESVQTGATTAIEIAETTKAILRQYKRWW